MSTSGLPASREKISPPQFTWDFKHIRRLFVTAYNDWDHDEAPRMGAALTFYTLLSLAPLLVVLITIASFAFGRQVVTGQLMYQISDMVGEDGARAIQGILKAATDHKATGVIASVVGLITLLFGASGVVSELRHAMNKVWRVPDPQSSGLLGMIKDRGYSMGLVLGTGFLLLVSLAASAGLAAVGSYVDQLLPLPEVALHAVSFLISFLVISGIFALMFKALPAISIKWGDVFFGAVFTAFLFTLGKTVIGLYLGKASFGSAFGAAGSLVIVLVWVYYSAQIFLFGAEFTRVYAGEHGSDIERQAGRRKLQNPPKWMRFDPSPAATGNAALPPILALEPKGERPRPTSQSLSHAAGSIAGSAAAIVKIVKRAARSH